MLRAVPGEALCSELPTKWTFIHFSEDLFQKAFLDRSASCPRHFAPATVAQAIAKEEVAAGLARTTPAVTSSSSRGGPRGNTYREAAAEPPTRRREQQRQERAGAQPAAAGRKSRPAPETRTANAPTPEEPKGQGKGRRQPQVPPAKPWGKQPQPLESEDALATDETSSGPGAEEAPSFTVTSAASFASEGEETEVTCKPLCAAGCDKVQEATDATPSTTPTPTTPATPTAGHTPVHGPAPTSAWGPGRAAARALQREAEMGQPAKPVPLPRKQVLPTSSPAPKAAVAPPQRVQPSAGRAAASGRPGTTGPPSTAGKGGAPRREEASATKRTTVRYEVGVPQEQDFNVMRRLLVPAGGEIKRIAVLSSVKICVRGQGSAAGLEGAEANEPLSICLQSPQLAHLSEACLEVEELLEKLQDQYRSFCQKKGLPVPDMSVSRCSEP